MSSRNVGKIFEQEIRDSVSKDILLHRVKDDTSSFNGVVESKYSVKNPFDYLAWNPRTLTLYALELKTVKGKSISFALDEDSDGDIRWHQIKALRKYSKYGVMSGFIIHFREIERTVFLRIGEFDKLVSLIEKKSFNIKDIEKYDISHVVIPQRKKRTRYAFDMSCFFEQTGLHNTEDT